MSIAKKGFQQYLLQLQEHPLRTKALTAGTLAAISDVVSQKLSGIQKLQIRRLLLKVVPVTLDGRKKRLYGQYGSYDS
ncbi:hypothetical protein Hdeb2414_s0007g00242021 [Helianthus debilis subsp. tardiflorus]